MTIRRGPVAIDCGPANGVSHRIPGGSLVTGALDRVPGPKTNAEVNRDYRQRHRERIAAQQRAYRAARRAAA